MWTSDGSPCSFLELMKTWALSPPGVKLTDSDSPFKVLSCLATLLRKQDLEAWSYPVTLQVYHGLLSFTVHSKPKVRLLGPQNMGGEGGGHSGNCAGAGLSEWDWGGCPEDTCLDVLLFASDALFA